MPSQSFFDPGTVQFQVSGLMRSPAFLSIRPCRTVSGLLLPFITEKLYQPPRRQTVGFLRTHIIASRIFSIFILHGCQAKISGNRFQNMLVGTDRPGISDQNVFSRFHCTHTVRYDPVRGEISSADHIARTGRRHCHSGSF